MLDKNADQFFDNVMTEIRKEFSTKNPNYILSSYPFLKSSFLIKLMESSNEQIIFLDFDLMYSGYRNSGLIKKNDNVKIFYSTKLSLNNDFVEIFNKIEKKKSVVILDSLNGVYNLFDELESVRFINAVIMLLSSAAKYSKSTILVTGMVRGNNGDALTLSPSGRQIIPSNMSGIYYLEKSDTSIILNLLDNGHESKKKFEITK